MIIELTGYSGAGKTEICKLFKKNRRWKIFEIGKYYDEYTEYGWFHKAEAWINFALDISKYNGNCIVEHCGIFPKREILDLAFKDKEVYSVFLDCSEEDMISRIKNKKWYKEALDIRKEKEIISTSKKLRKKCNGENKGRWRWVYDSSKLSSKEIYNKICKDLDIGRKKEDKYFFNIVEYGIMNPKFAGYRSGRIEVHKKGENYAIDEGNFLIPEKYIEQFRDMLDFTYTDIPLRIHLDMFKYPDEDKKYYANLK